MLRQPFELTQNERVPIEIIECEDLVVGIIVLNRPNLDDLAVLIQSERESLLKLWREQVRQIPSAQQLDIPTLNDHVPKFLDELCAAFRTINDVSNPEAISGSSPAAHGLQRIHDGFKIEEIVAEYNILRGCIHDLADRHAINLQGKAFHILNTVFDGAIGLAVQSYALCQALETQQRREEYLAFVIHDLRTPINAISLTARALEMILLQKNAGDDSGKLFKSLRRNIEYLDGLVRKIIEENTHLQTEMGLKLQCRSLDFWPLVESLIRDLQPVSESVHTKLINMVPYELAIYADASLLKRILQNLIANAIKYTPNGEVIIGAKNCGEDGSVECWVRDNGQGIPETTLDKVFDKGETDSQDEGGMGLGLAIVKAFTEAHGGQVSVESKYGSGAEFRFSLPGASQKTMPTRM